MNNSNEHTYSYWCWCQCECSRRLGKLHWRRYEQFWQD